MATVGMRYFGGTCSTRTNMPTIGMLRSSSMRLAMNSAAISPQTTSGCWREQQRAGRDVEGEQHGQQHGGRPRSRHAERQHGHQRAAGGGVVARLGRRDAARIALAEGAVLVLEPLLERVGDERAERGAGAGQDAGEKADDRCRAPWCPRTALIIDNGAVIRPSVGALPCLPSPLCSRNRRTSEMANRPTMATRKSIPS